MIRFISSRFLDEQENKENSHAAASPDPENQFNVSEDDLEEALEIKGTKAAGMWARFCAVKW
jgi:hypothetical protein